MNFFPPRQLEPELRALIDEAIKAGRVTRCPDPVFAPPKHTVTEPLPSIERRGAVMGAKQRLIGEANRHAILALLTAGLTKTQICEKLMLSRITVTKHVEALADLGQWVKVDGRRKRG